MSDEPNRPELARLLDEHDHPREALEKYEGTAEDAAWKLIRWTPECGTGQRDEVERVPLLSSLRLGDLLSPSDAAEFLALLRPVLAAAGLPEGRLP